MPDPNTMTATIVVDDSQEEEVAQRHKRRMGAMQQDGERTAQGQTRAFKSAHEQIIAGTERVGNAHQTMFSRIERGAQDTGRAFGSVFDFFSRLMLKSAELVGAAALLGATIKGAVLAWGASTAAAMEHAGVMSHVVDIYRAVRLAISPTLFTATTLGLGALVEYTIQLAVARDRIIKQDALLAATSKQSYFNVSTFGEAGVVSGAGRGSYQGLLKGQSPYDVPQMVDDFKQLRDPVEQANFAIKHFGENAAQALPLIGDRLKFDTERAFELSTMLSGKTRASLEQVAIVAHRPIEALHGLGDAIRALREEAKQEIVIKVAWVANSLADAMQAGDEARSRLNAAGKPDWLTSGSPVGGLDLVHGRKTPIPSDLSFAIGANAAAKAAQERMQAGIGAPDVSSRLVQLSDRATTRNAATAEGLSRQLSEAQSKLHNDEDLLKRAIGTTLENTVRIAIIQDERTIAALKPMSDAAKRRERLNEELEKLREEGMPFLQVGSTIIRGADINKANPSFRAPTLFGRGDAGRLGFDDNAARLTRESASLPPGMQFQGQDVFISPSSARGTTGYQLDAAGNYTGGGTSADILNARFAGSVDWRKQNEQIALSGINATASATARILELRAGPGGEIAAARQAGDVRETALRAEYSITQDIVRYREASLQNELDQRVKIAEIKKRQHDEIAQPAAGLFNTLFTNPRGFGRQLGSTLQGAVLHPITEGLGNMAANLLHPMIFGKDGTGGIAGMFGGRQDPVKLSTDQNTTATLQNSAAIAALTMALAGGMGMASPAMAFTGGGGFSAPSIASAAATGGADLYNLPVSGGGALGGLLGGFGSAGSPGGTPGFVGPVGSLGGGIFRSAGGGFHMPSLSALKGSFWNQDIYSAPGAAHAAGGSFGGTLAGILTSKGASSLMIAGGLPLALAGITGGRRGTWGGIGETTLGGMLTGAGIGTMILPGIGTVIGAGIGAVTGFGIGLGEKIAGVETPEREASRKIKSIYGIDIPQSSGTIKQIVAIAQQQFGGEIGSAVRSPSVRQLVMLYSEATGQRMQMSAATPYGGSLVEQGGKLYQQATWQNNQMGAYASNLPVLGGYSPSLYPSSGGGLHLSLSVGGNSAAAFMRGDVVTPQFVTDQSMAAQSAGYFRTQQSANLQAPGLTVG